MAPSAAKPNEWWNHSEQEFIVTAATGQSVVVSPGESVVLPADEDWSDRGWAASPDKPTDPAPAPPVVVAPEPEPEPPVEPPAVEPETPVEHVEPTA